MILAVYVAVMDVRERPYITGVGTPHVISFSVVLLRHSNVVQVELETRCFGEHEDVVVSWAKPPGLSHTLGVMPDDPTVEKHAQFAAQNII